MSRLCPWSVYLGRGRYPHAALALNATHTLCGRSTVDAREWVSPDEHAFTGATCIPCYRSFEKINDDDS